MEKILFLASVDDHIIGFHIPFIKWFNNLGYEVHVASNGNGKIPYVEKKFNVPFARSPLKTVNIKAYKQIKNIINEYNYNLIHCHTPMASVIARLAARNARKRGTKIIYTAHGFHFFKGAPILNWLIYYPIEKLLARCTDCLITINKEDYNRAKRKLAIKDIRFVNGVGIDPNVFQHQTKEIKNELRKIYGYNENDFILIYAGELSYRKHQDLLINAVYKVKNYIPNIKLLLAGKGVLYDKYNDMIRELGLEQNVFLLGTRSDVSKLMILSDLAVSSSRQEGLPVNVMEAMATGLPVIATDCRGNRDLIQDNENGYIIDINDIEGFSNAIIKMFNYEETRTRFSNRNKDIIVKHYISNIIEEMGEIYKEYL